MASFDIESIGPQLKKIKVSQLEPDLLVSVLELAEEHGYEVTITSSSNLQFLFKIYQAEKVKERRDQKRLKKAENLITRLAIIYSLHHEGQRRENREQSEEKRPRIQQSILEEEMRISKKMRELFESVGIIDGKEMQETIGLFGESKVEERVAMIRKTELGDDLIKSFFGEHPEVLRIVKDDDFAEELKAMESKKDTIDAWKNSTNKSPPVWADYGESPSVLLVDYQNLSHGLEINTDTGGGALSNAEHQQSMNLVQLHELLEGLGFKLISGDTELVLENNDGRVLTISKPADGEYDPVTIGSIIGNFGLRQFGNLSDEKTEEHESPPSRQEKTTPNIPGALKRDKKPGRRENEDQKVHQRHLDALENYEPSRRAYVEAGGGLSGMLAALQEKGIDVKGLHLELENISEDSDIESRSRDQERFDGSISFLFDLIFTNNLENEISGNLGAETLNIGKIRYLVGANGAFELHMSDQEGAVQRRFYLSLQDMEPAKIGKDAIESAGMLSHHIWTMNFEGSKKYAILEDVREVGGRGKVKIRTGSDLKFEEVNTIGAAVFKEDLALSPDPDNQLHREYYQALANEKSRKEIFRSLLGYFEMSRRTLLPDRRPQNTYMLMVENSKGKRGFTFQPMDMDGIGNFIGSKEGEPDFSDFNNDFYKAAVDFAVHMHEGMVRASGRKMIDDDKVPGVSEIVFELITESKKPFGLDDDEVNAKRREVLTDNDGKMIGIGFDATQYVGHSIPSQGGQSNILRSDGRVQLEASRAVLTASRAGTLMSQLEFIDGLQNGSARRLSKLPKKAAEIAKSIVDANANKALNDKEREEKVQRLRTHTGGEIAFTISKNTEFAGAETEELRMQVGQRIAKEIIFGGNEELLVEESEEEKPEKKDRTKAGRGSR